MALITILEQGSRSQQPAVVIDGQEYPVTPGIIDPFSPEQEKLLEWYFEEYGAFPFIHQASAQEAARSITAYGERLFAQLFADRPAFEHYQRVLQQGTDDLSLEIVGSPPFQRLYWEALKDPALPHPLSLMASLVRRDPHPRGTDVHVRASSTLNILVVAARPEGKRDVGYRTVSRPLLEAQRQAGLEVKIDLLRPGTYEALVKHLRAFQDSSGAGYYHIIHFDVHGEVLTYGELEQWLGAALLGAQARPLRPELSPYEGSRAFLFLEGPAEGQVDAVEASEVASLLLTHQIPIAILNACQSGRQAGASETSLGSQLVQAGLEMVLAMRHSISADAVKRLMAPLYTHLFAGLDLGTATRRARWELYQNKERQAFFDQRVDMEEWLLPVVYQRRPQRLEVRTLAGPDAPASARLPAERYRAPEAVYGFVGRDVDVLHIERKLLAVRNLLLVRGMAGAGKSTLLHHLGAWWQATGLVDQVFYFGYDERAWTRRQVLDALGRRLLGEQDYLQQLQALGEERQEEQLVERLRARRHLLILDNLESITGAPLSILHTLPPEEQQALRSFLRKLVNGDTLVLLGSRGDERWLAPDTFDDNLYLLPGLDPEAASQLAERILARHGATRYRADEGLQALLNRLDGFPLALEVVLSNLARLTPAQVLEGLEGGWPAVDSSGDPGEAEALRTRSLLGCIGYSFRNLTPEAQRLLLCLAPFTGLLHVKGLFHLYSASLKQEPELAGLPFERWPEVLAEAEHWGLLTPHHEQPAFLSIQPIFPYFLRTRLQEHPAMTSAIERAFCQYYEKVGEEAAAWSQSQVADQRQQGLQLTLLEYANLMTAVQLTLARYGDFFHAFHALERFLESWNAHPEALALSEKVLAAASSYPPEHAARLPGRSLVTALFSRGLHHLWLRQYGDARASYEEVLRRVDGLPDTSEAFRTEACATAYHQLGRVAQEQGLWVEAQGLFERSLQLKLDAGDLRGQARTYHQLGMVTQAQRQWRKAEAYFQQARSIFLQLDDRDDLARTYHHLGMVAQELHQFAQAEDFLLQALELKSELRQRHSQASTYHQLGVGAQDQGQWGRAYEFFQQALVICLEFNDRLHLARVYHHLGLAAQEQRQWDHATGYFEKSRELKEAVHDRAGLANAYHHLGVVAQEQKLWAEATRCFQQSLALNLELDNRSGQAGTYHHLGMMAQAQGQWTQAGVFFRKALEVGTGATGNYSPANTYHHLGMMAQAQQSWAQALAYLLKDLEWVVRSPDSKRIALTLRRLGMLWIQSRDDFIPAQMAPYLRMPVTETEALLLQLLGLPPGSGRPGR